MYPVRLFESCTSPADGGKCVDKLGMKGTQKEEKKRSEGMRAFVLVAQASSPSVSMGIDKDCPMWKGMTFHSLLSHFVPTHVYLSLCIHSNRRLLYDWTQRVKNKVQESQGNFVQLLAKKRGPRRPNEDDSAATENGSVIAAVAAATRVAGGIGKARQISKPRRRVVAMKPTDNPMAILSSNTRIFMRAAGFITAEQVMSTKSTTIAKLYINWRAKENMSVLKGMGAIATVSGWKAMIRKFAMETGNLELAKTAPQDKWSKESDGKPSVAVKDAIAASSKTAIQNQLFTTHPGILCGLPIRRFVVRSPKGALYSNPKVFCTTAPLPASKRVPW